MLEITHRRDPDTGHYVQVVTPARLREILHADGETHDRPKHFGPDDEWDVDDEACEHGHVIDDVCRDCGEACAHADVGAENDGICHDSSCPLHGEA